MEVPQGQTRRQAFLLLELDGGGQLQVAEVRDILGAEADADELDLGDDEAVAAGMLAHVPMDLAQAGEVLDAALAHGVAHACVPAVERLDDADDAAAAVARERLLDVVLVVGDELGAVTCLVGAHGEVVRAVDGAAEGGADFGNEEGSVDILESGFGTGVESGLRDRRIG